MNNGAVPKGIVSSQAVWTVIKFPHSSDFLVGFNVGIPYFFSLKYELERFRRACALTSIEQ